MRRIAGLWSRVVAPENLEAAFLAARRGKRGRADVALFCLDQERELRSLRQALQDRSYEPGGYRQFEIYERKPRVISAAPFRDRVVHHALMRVVEPILDRRMYAHSYACRAGKGVHAAVNTYESWARRHPYVLKMDLRAYFPSIDRILLLEEIARYIKDAGCLWLFERIISCAPPTSGPAPLLPGDDLLTALDRPCGLPIGNLTSQILANLYLNRLDHWIASAYPDCRFLRYVDDMLVVGDSKTRLWGLQRAVSRRLQTMRLQLHPNKSHVMPTRRKVDVLGYQVVPGRRWVRGENVRRAGRRLRALARHPVDVRRVDASVQAWIGHVSHAHAWGLCRRVLRSVRFR